MSDPFMEIEKIDRQLQLWAAHLRKPQASLDKLRSAWACIDGLLDRRLLVAEMDSWRSA